MQLIPIENVNAIELFKSEKTLGSLLAEIKKTATDFDPDTSTPDGRKEIASQAYKVSQSKTVIDAAGKELTAEWLRKKKEVDAGRKLARDFCDNLRDEIRQPLTEYENEEKRLAEIAAQKAEDEAAELEAYAENELFNREAKMAAWETEQQAIADERAQKEADEQAEKQRLELLEQVRKDAEERAQREAAEALEQERQKVAEAEQRGHEQAEQAERDRIQAEADKQAAIEREQQRAKDEADRLERERLRRIEDNEREAQARAADTENRRNINRAIVTALVDGGVTQKAAKQVVVLVASGKVPSMAIRY
jgi:hypothetical protein